MVKSKSIWVVVFLVILAIVVAGSCSESEKTGGEDTSGVPQTTATPIPTSTLVQGTYDEGPSFNPEIAITTNSFSSLEEFNNFIKKYEVSSNYLYDDFMFYGEVVALDAVAESMPQTGAVVPAPMVDESGRSYSPDFSETNVQVMGVDEADIIKTDGNYIYTITSNVLFIIKAYPGEDAEIVAEIDFDQNYPTSLFINGDYLAVFGNLYDRDFFNELDFVPMQGMTFFDIYDISDRSVPRVIKEYKFEGNYFDARMTDGYVYFVVGNGMTFRPGIPTPLMFDGDVKIAMPVTDIYYYPIPYDSPQLMSIHAINLVDPADDVESKSMAVEWSQNLYMSQNNIFITYTQQVNEWELMQEIQKDLLEDDLTDADRELIDKIKATDDDVLSQNEKEAKIWQVYSLRISYMPRDKQEDFQDEVERLLELKLKEFDHFEYTIINKIAVDDGDIEIAGNGKVPGHVINQFSMDEDVNNEVLRIATTISGRWSRFGELQTESANNVYTLDTNMEIIGGLEGLAETESIYATRFIGDKLYMVTFRQVDPFFVIDLSDPSNITELGQLKIPGFSRYLHPYDENTLIGIGQDATETGRTTGLKISLFDVSDFSHPKEIAKYVTEERYADSTALYEHKAFLFSKDKELLVIPAHNYDYRWDWEDGGEGDDTYNGAFVFHITKDEIELRGLIDHSKSLPADQYYWGSLVQRSLYIEDLLYTKSPNLLRINEIEDLSSVKDITLKTSDFDFPIF